MCSFSPTRIIHQVVWMLPAQCETSQLVDRDCYLLLEIRMYYRKDVHQRGTTVSGNLVLRLSVFLHWTAFAAASITALQQQPGMLVISQVYNVFPLALLLCNHQGLSPLNKLPNVSNDSRTLIDLAHTIPTVYVGIVNESHTWAYRRKQWSSSNMCDIQLLKLIIGNFWRATILMSEYFWTDLLMTFKWLLWSSSMPWKFVKCIFLISDTWSLRNMFATVCFRVLIFSYEFYLSRDITSRLDWFSKRRKTIKLVICIKAIK